MNRNYGFLMGGIRLICLLALFWSCERVYAQSFSERVRLFISEDFIKAKQILESPYPIFFREKNAVIFQTRFLVKGIEPQFPFDKFLTNYCTITPEGKADSAALFLGYGTSELVLIGSNAEGNRLLLTDRLFRSELFVLDVFGRRTPRPRKVENFYNGGFPIHSGTISSDGSWIVISTARPGTLGGYDLFTVKADNTNHVLLVKNAGQMINSVRDEIFPKFSHSDSMLLFASNGHSSNGQFQLYEARISNGNLTPANILIPFNSNTEEVCRYEPIDSVMAMVTIFNLEEGFVNQWKEIGFNRMRWNVPFEPIDVQPKMRHFPLKGMLCIDRKKVDFPVEISLFDSIGRIISTTCLSDNGTYYFPQAPAEPVLILFSSAYMVPMAAYLCVPNNYKYPFYVIDVAINERRINPDFTTVCVNQLSPLQQREIHSKVFGHAGYQGTFTIVENCVNGHTQNMDLAITETLPRHFEKKCNPLLSIFPKNLMVKSPPFSILQLDLKTEAYPRYVVGDGVDDAQFATLGSEYTIIVGNAEDIDPYRLMQFASIYKAGNLRINQTHSGDEYCLGSFSDLGLAQSFLPELKKMGYRDAKIGVYDPLQNSFMPIIDLKNGTNSLINSNKIYVRVYSSTTILPPTVFPMPGKIAIIVDKNGVFHYIYPTENNKVASETLTVLKKQGFSATIVNINREK